MDDLLTIILLIIGIPIALGISFVVGLIFRMVVLKHDMDRGNMYLQAIFTIAIGIFVIMIIGTITDKMGCSSDSDLYY